MKLLNNSGTEAFREIAFKLKDDGVTEEEYKIMLNRVLPGWFNGEDRIIRTLNTLNKPSTTVLKVYQLMILL